MIIDAELHLLHPEALSPAFHPGSAEPVTKALYEHSDFPAIQDKLTVEALRASMRRNGVGAGVIMGMPWRDWGIQRDNNRFVEATARASGGRLKALYIPTLDDPQQAAREVEGLDGGVYLGVKLIPSWQGRAIDDEALAPLIRVVEARGMFLMIHTDHPTQSLDGDTPYRLLRFVTANPAVRVLAPHLGGLLCLYALRPGIAKALGNVTFVTSVSATMRMVRFAAEVNPANIVFGSDFPFNHCHDQETVLRELRGLTLPPEVERMILRDTAARLLGFEGIEEE